MKNQARMKNQAMNDGNTGSGLDMMEKQKKRSPVSKKLPVTLTRIKVIDWSSKWSDLRP